MMKYAVDNGGVLAFIERPAKDDRPQRWSQLPQLTLAWDTPTYMYLSHGLGLVRLSYHHPNQLRMPLNTQKIKD